MKTMLRANGVISSEFCSMKVAFLLPILVYSKFSEILICPIVLLLVLALMLARRLILLRSSVRVL